MLIAAVVPKDYTAATAAGWGDPLDQFQTYIPIHVNIGPGFKKTIHVFLCKCNNFWLYKAHCCRLEAMLCLSSILHVLRQPSDRIKELTAFKHSLSVCSDPGQSLGLYRQRWCYFLQNQASRTLLCYCFHYQSSMNNSVTCTQSLCFHERCQINIRHVKSCHQLIWKPSGCVSSEMIVS